MFFVILYTAIIVGCVVVDQITKMLAQNGNSFNVLGSFLGVKYVENRGMAYGMLADWKYSQLLFCIMTILILIVGLVILLKIKNRNKCFCFGIIYDTLFHRQTIFLRESDV